MRRAYQDTSVPAGHTRDLIERELMRYGAEGVAWQSFRTKETAAISLRFEFNKRMYKFQIHLGESPQDERRLMRVLYHGIKALLTQAEAGVLLLEDLLMAYTELSLSNGGSATVGEIIREQLNAQRMPDLTAGLKALPMPQK